MGNIEKQKFICIDCETTGLDTQQDRIIEVAVMCFDEHTIYEQMESLVNPECEIPQSSTDIHHITQDMVENQPTIAQILPEILTMIGNHIIIGHGVKFDIEMIAAAADRVNLPCNLRYNRYMDTLRMARLYGESPVNSLEHLRKHFNIPLEGAHRAMSDVIVNREVFRQLAKKFKTTEQLFDILSRPILMNAMPFGKHKGRPFKDIPLQYLQWMANKDFDQDLLFSIRTELKKRKQGNQFSQHTNPFMNI